MFFNFLILIGDSFGKSTVDVPSLEEPFRSVFSMALPIFKLLGSV